MGGPVGRLGLAGFPFGKGEKVAVLIGRGAGGWVEAGLVRGAGPHRLGHYVVNFEDDALGAVFAVLFLVLALHDGEGVHDVFHGMARGGKVSDEAFGLAAPFILRTEVEVKEGSIQLAADKEPALLVRTELGA